MAVGSFKLPNVTIPVVDPSGWTRPSDWLAMPTIGVQEFIGLLSITDDQSNYIALLCQGNYTVDWGDGVIENVIGNVKAQHQYTYSAIGGTPTSRGYKQVLVRVTPQAGQNLTRINLQQQHGAIPRTQGAAWLDIAINAPNVTLLNLGGISVWQAMCENVDIYSLGGATSLAELFNNFAALQKFTLNGTSLVQNWSNAFDGCRSLRVPSFFNMNSATTCVSMFYNCSSLISIPLYNTVNVNNMQQMFYGCSALPTIPLLNMGNVTNALYMFQQCYSLSLLPLLNTIKVTNFAQIFYQCWALQTIPNFNTSACIGFSATLGSTSIARGAFQGTKVSISYAGLFYGQAALVEVFNGLATIAGQTLTITNNPGTASLTAAEKLIATSKGWTLVL